MHFDKETKKPEYRDGFHNPNDQPKDPENTNGYADGFSEKSIRMAFIRKVYAIVMVQLAITTASICLFIFEPNVKLFSRKHPELLYISMGIYLVLMIALVCCERVRRSYPLNYICLFLFTICLSIMLGFITSRFETKAVLMAAGISAGVSLGLTIFAFQTKIDFTACSGALFVMLLILFIFGIVMIFIPHNKITMLVYGCLGALVFSLYLVFDTQLMMGGNHQYSLSPEEYIFAALNIYLDVVQIFIFILQIVGAANN